MSSRKGNVHAGTLFALHPLQLWREPWHWELPSVSLKQTRQTGFFVIVVVRDSIFQAYLQPPPLPSVSSRKELVQDGVRLQLVHECRDPWHCELPSVSAKQRRYSLFLLMLWCASIFHWYRQPPDRWSVSSRNGWVHAGFELQPLQLEDGPWHCELRSVSRKQILNPSSAQDDDNQPMTYTKIKRCLLSGVNMFLCWHWVQFSTTTVRLT